METLIGLVGKDFVMTATDMSAVQSIVVFKTDEDKSRHLTDHIVLAFCGEAGDTVQFAEYIEKNVKLYTLRNGIELNPEAAANYTRNELAQALRSRNSYAVNVLLAGFDPLVGPQLFWMDYLASLAKVPYAAHGYGSFFVLSTLDRHYQRDLTVEEALDVMRKCVHEVQTRFLVNQPNFRVKVIDKDGIRVVNL